jgi:hypothetical protein
MAWNDDLTTAEFLQPAAGPASLSGTISFGDASAELVGAIRSGAVVLDVADTEAWLTRFDELAKVVENQRGQLRQAAGWVATDQSLGNFELSRQIRAKLADRIGDAEGGFALAVDEVAQALRDIYQAIRSSLVTHVAADEASAERLKRLAGQAPEGEGSARG